MGWVSSFTFYFHIFTYFDIFIVFLLLVLFHCSIFSLLSPPFFLFFFSLSFLSLSYLSFLSTYLLSFPFPPIFLFSPILSFSFLPGVFSFSSYFLSFLSLFCRLSLVPFFPFLLFFFSYSRRHLQFFIH